MPYTVAEITAAQGDDLVKDDKEAYKNQQGDRFFTYEDIAEKDFLPADYSIVTISNLQNAGTLPIDSRKPVKPMFPR